MYAFSTAAAVGSGDGAYATGDDPAGVEELAADAGVVAEEAAAVEVDDVAGEADVEVVEGSV